MMKLKNYDEIKEIGRVLRNEGKKIITTNGCFDILHCAHINLLEKAKNEGDALIVLLNSDQSIKKFKGEKRPIISEEERAKMLAALESVDYVVVFNEDTPLKILELIKPHKHVKGGSFVLERVKAEKELVESWGGELKNFELEEGFSTTNIIDKILQNY